MENTDPAAALIGMINTMVETRMKTFNSSIKLRFSPSIDKIHQLQFSSFKECVQREGGEVPKCTEQTRKYEVNVDTGVINHGLNDCINKTLSNAIGKTNSGWENSITGCLENYEKQVNGQLERQFQRILKL